MTKNYNNIPAEIRAKPNWVGFKITPKADGNGWNKLPINIKTGKAASSTDSSTWTDFASAVNAVKNRRYGISDIGYAFDGGGIIGIDIDHCAGKDGELNAMAKDILSTVSSYTEYSVSGGGIHIIAQTSEQFESGKHGDFEIYRKGRFFVFTGNLLGDKLTEILDCTEEIKKIYMKYMPHKSARETSTFGCEGTVLPSVEPQQTAHLTALNAPLSGVRPQDEQILEIAKASRSGARFADLWSGNASAYPSYSEADLALCNILAFYTAKDEIAMDRLFRASGLYTAEGRAKKWSERHGGETYGEITIRKAINNCREVYKPPTPRKKRKSASTDTAVFVKDNCYCVHRGEDIKTLTNFIIKPLEIVEFENDSRMTGKLTNSRGEVTGRTIRISDFNSVSLFRDAISRNALNFIVTCSDTELQYIKDYIARLPCAIKQGYKGVGIEFVSPSDGGMVQMPVFVCKDGAFAKGWERYDKIVQMTGSENIVCDISSVPTLDRADLEYSGKHYVQYNEKPKTLSILCYAAACFIKPYLKRHGIKFPNLILYGEHGSGKSTTYKEFLCPFFSTGGAPPISKMTGFTFLHKAASSNCVPMAFDEYKPSTLSKYIANEIHNVMRDAYDGEHGERGKADQTVRHYDISAPLVVIGEEAPFEPAIRERSIILQFSKADIADKKDCAAKLTALNTRNVTFGKALTQSFGKTVLLTALNLSSHKVKAAYDDAVTDIKDSLDPRVINNIAVLLTGAWLLEQTCYMLGTSFQEAFGLEWEDIRPEVIKAVKDYTLDGVENTKGVVENSLEVMDRMVPSVLKAGYHFKLCEDRNKIAINFKRIYDEFTKYVKDKAIAGEFVDFSNFKAQLRKKVYFAKYGTARFKLDAYGQGEGEPEGCYHIDAAKMREYCDIGNILREVRWSPPVPTQGSLFDDKTFTK